MPGQAKEGAQQMPKRAKWVLALVVGIAAGVFVDRVTARGGTDGRTPLYLPAGEPPEHQAPSGVSAERAVAGRQAWPVEASSAVYRVPVDDSPTKGPADALVTIVESSDFQCPFCRQVVPTLKRIEQAYAGKVRFVFKHNPIAFHDKAMPAAIAAEQARAEGGDRKFWAMHDKLFEISPALDRAALERAGREVGLNVHELRRALDSNRYEARVRRDQALVASVGASATPAFFINGRKLSGAQPFESFKTVIDEELGKAEEMARAGIPPKDLYAHLIEKGITGPPMPQVARPLPTGPSAAAQRALPRAVAPAHVTLRKDDPAKGNPRAPVTIVIFSDFQSPFYGRAEPTLRLLQRTYGDRLRLIWKHAPLAFHSNAMPAARAAEAAREQGKFWQMHDKLLQNQSALSPDGYERWAKEIGLNLARFRASLQSEGTGARIYEDLALAKRVGANTTPTFFINGERLVGAQPFVEFKKIVDRQLGQTARR